MQILSKLLDPTCILLDRSEDSIDAIINTLTGQLTQRHPDVATEELMHRVLKNGFNTVCIGEGCAITHARCPAMEKTLMAVMRLSEGLDLGAQDLQKVRLVFLLVGPQSSASFHLKILSRLARILHNAQLREYFFAIATAEQFFKELETKEQ
ncbi:MAG: PTS sugar transporter subunit IIA [Spirochaetia bacterium]|nr:PTS sugar transporter subunit IIA [Spirochaetia bacterium]